MNHSCLIQKSIMSAVASNSGTRTDQKGCLSECLIASQSKSKKQSLFPLGGCTPLARQLSKTFFWPCREFFRYLIPFFLLTFIPHLIFKQDTNACDQVHTDTKCYSQTGHTEKPSSSPFLTPSTDRHTRHCCSFTVNVFLCCQERLFDLEQTCNNCHN